MDKSKEEYLKLIEKRQIKENDLPRELLDDEEFVRQVYSISTMITRVANVEIITKILREEIKQNPLIIKYFPKDIILRCETDCINILKGKSSVKYDFLKSCPKEILLNNIEVCEELLEGGMISSAFPKEVLLKCKVTSSVSITNKGIAHEVKQNELESVKSSSINLKTQYSTQPNKTRQLNVGDKTYSKEYLLTNPVLARRLIKSGTSLEHIPRECQLLFSSLCIEHLKDGDY